MAVADVGDAVGRVWVLIAVRLLRRFFSDQPPSNCVFLLTEGCDAGACTSPCSVAGFYCAERCSA